MKEYEVRPAVFSDSTKSGLSEARKAAFSRAAKEKPNFKIRIAMFEKGITQWQLAQMLGISEATMCRHMRNELSPSETDRILRIINGEGDQK